MTTSLATAEIMAFLATARPDESRRFYADTLGLEFVEDNGYSLIFRVGETLALRIQKVAELVPQQSTVFGWRVEDIDSAHAELSARGVEFLHIGMPEQDERGVCAFPNGDKVAWFRDPDGNTLSIAETPPAETPDISG